MKKFALALMIGMVGAAAHAETSFQAATPEIGPCFNFGVFQDNQGVLRDMQANTLSRSNANARVCWAVFSDSPVFGTTVNLKENFVSPAGARFTDDQSIVQSSIDGSKHTVSKIANSMAGTAVHRCWKFDPTDPVGTYTLTVEVDGKSYPARSFVVNP